MSRDVELLYELSALRHIPRQWVRFGMPGVSRLAEHHYQVTWIALILAARIKEKVDTDKVLKMALAHDIAESRTNDVDYISRQYVTKDEQRALHDMLKGTSISEEFESLIKEYEQRESLEAKIVKDADNLHVDLELCEQKEQGNGLPDKWRGNRDGVSRKKLFTAEAKQLYKELIDTAPSSWHTESPNNRVHSGDWVDIKKPRETNEN